MDWWELAKQTYQKRGYLVLCDRRERKIGEIVLRINDHWARKTVNLPQPFRVICATTLADYQEQHELAGVHYQPSEDRACFYRIVTD